MHLIHLKITCNLWTKRWGSLWILNGNILVQKKDSRRPWKDDVKAEKDSNILLIHWVATDESFRLMLPQWTWKSATSMGKMNSQNAIVAIAGSTTAILWIQSWVLSSYDFDQPPLQERTSTVLWNLFGQRVRVIFQAHQELDCLVLPSWPPLPVPVPPRYINNRRRGPIHRYCDSVNVDSQTRSTKV